MMENICKYEIKQDGLNLVTTSCGYMFKDPTPAWRFCPYCGKEIWWEK